MGQLTGEQIQYMKDHIDDTQVAGIIVSFTVCCAASLLAIVLRFISRYSGGGFGKDDYCILVAFTLYLLYTVSYTYSTKFGNGRHIILVTDVRSFAINNIVSMTSYVGAIVALKFSVLLLYHRIFPGKRVRNTLIAMGVFVLAWGLVGFFTSLFNCYPISSTWDASTPGHCIDYGLATLIFGILNIVIDIVMLAYPMPLVWKLNMSTSRKVFLSLAFVSGSIACIVTVVRLPYVKNIVTSADPSWDDTQSAVLSNLELCTGIVACCCVTYRPLIERIFGRNKQSVISESNRGIKLQSSVVISSQKMTPMTTVLGHTQQYDWIDEEERGLRKSAGDFGSSGSGSHAGEILTTAVCSRHY